MTVYKNILISFQVYPRIISYILRTNFFSFANRINIIFISYKYVTNNEVDVIYILQNIKLCVI